MIEVHYIGGPVDGDTTRVNLNCNAIRVAVDGVIHTYERIGRTRIFAWCGGM